MIINLGMGKFFALYIECARVFGAKPLIAVKQYKSEIIVDLPFCQMIFTPGKRLKQRGTFFERREIYDRGRHDGPRDISGNSKNAPKR